MNVAQSFDAAASRYDSERARLVPFFDALYGTAVGLLDLDPAEPAEILDLGAGTGVLSRLVHAALPKARLTLIDIAPAMLAEAARNLAADGCKARIVVGDYGRLPLGGTYAAVVSALSIHHLEHADKRRLFAAVHAALRPAGIFINLDQVLGPTPALEAEYEAAWQSAVRRAGADEDMIARAEERMRLHDRNATAADQLRWLGEAGFVDADIWFKSGRFAVFSGRKREPTSQA